MALKDMTIPQMLRITNRWLVKDKAVLEKTPELNGSIRMLQKAHQGLLAPVAPPENEEIKTIQVYQQGTDVIFDRKARGTIMCFAAFAELATDPQRTDRFLQLSKELLPLQLSTVNQTYEEEAGTALAIEAKLNIGIQAELKELSTFGGRTLLDEVRDIVSSGKRIGELEDQKKKLQLELHIPTADSDRREARLLWIRTVNAFLGIVDIAEITKEEREIIRGPVHRAEEVVARRKKGEDIKDEDIKDEDNADNPVPNLLTVPPKETERG
jgi:hypothetical protein